MQLIFIEDNFMNFRFNKKQSILINSEFENNLMFVDLSRV